MGKPSVGVFKLASCDGCQLSILNLEEEILEILSFIDIGYFREASDSGLSGVFDIAVVEGSISTDRQRTEIMDIRDSARFLMTIGACATSGGVQALRNWASLQDFKGIVYPSPEMVSSLNTSTPVSDHVYVDYELWGCPISKDAFSETLISLLMGRRPSIPRYSLCMDCKNRGIPCILVAGGEPCLGPVTKAGCGVLCPSLGRACYGCFGPKEGANIGSLMNGFRKLGFSPEDCAQLLDKMNTMPYRRARAEEEAE